MILGRIIWNEDWLGPATNPHKVHQASKILHGFGVNCVSLIGAVYVWYYGVIIVHAKLLWFISLCHVPRACDQCVVVWVCACLCADVSLWERVWVRIRACMQVNKEIIPHASLLKSRAAAFKCRSISQSKTGGVLKKANPGGKLASYYTHFIF